MCCIYDTTATQLLSNTTRFSPPLGHWNPETLEPRVEAPGHWNLGTLEPQVHMEGKGHRPENRQRAPTRGTAKGTDPRNGFLFFRYPVNSRWRFLRCAFHCRAAHGGYDVLGGARWLQVQLLVSLFSRDSCETKGRNWRKCSEAKVNAFRAEVNASGKSLTAKRHEG